MESLRVSVYLSTPFIAFDDWTPSLDQILIWALLDQHGLLLANPDQNRAAKNHDFIAQNLPIEMGDIGGEWYHKCSAPHYLYEDSGILETVRMWTQQDQHLDWGKSRRAWNVQGFSTKTWRHKDPLRVTPRIDWFCVGDADRILSLTKSIDGIGKRRLGQVARWQVEQCKDWHLSRDGELMKPMPMGLIWRPEQFAIRQWGWRSPINISENITKCVMPINNAQRVRSLYGVA